MFPTLADAYDRYIGRYSRQLARQFISVVGIGGDQRVLDVGCGPGSLTTALVEVPGAERVCAVDPSEPYVEACRARAPGADVRVGRAEALPFADGAFDVVLAQLVVNLLEHPEKAIQEMAQVSEPAGLITAAVWAQDGMPLLRAFWDAAGAVAPDAVAAVGESGRVGYRYEQLAALWERSGMTDVSMAELEAAVAYEDFDESVGADRGWRREVRRALPLARGDAPEGASHRDAPPARCARSLLPAHRTGLVCPRHSTLTAPFRRSHHSVEAFRDHGTSGCRKVRCGVILHSPLKFVCRSQTDRRARLRA